MKNFNPKNFAVVIAGFICCNLVAQPANDFCNAAQNVTPNGTCVAGTTVAAADNWTGTVGCQTGNPNAHPDVWYSFVSTGNTFTSTITGSGSWAGNVEFTMVSGTCAGGFTLIGSACGASPLNVNIPSIINGATYYFTISNSATGTPGPFQVCPTTTISPVPGNDDCSGATNLGTLPTPGACGAGLQNGAAVVVAGTNVNATPESPYVTLNGCGMASPANSVWYRFVDPPSGYGLTINVSGGTLANPNIALWNGTTCGSLAGVNCIVGSGNTATLTISNGIVPGQTYYIQLSGNTGQSGTYNLSVNAFQDCSDCLNAASLIATPPPVNGTYQPGQVVSFCFHIDRWTQTVNNWLHGVQLAFGPGWNLPTLTTSPPPAYVSTSTFWGAVSPASCGNWAYYPAGTTSSATGVAWPAGFYFDGVYTTNFLGIVTGCGSLTGNPGNNFGDGVANSGLVITPPANQWNFCWTITVKPGCNPGMSLSMAVNTSGDGESGSWTSAGCASDPPVNFTAQIACCPPTMASTGTCTGLSTGTATTTPVGVAGPYTYSWSAGGQNTQTITGLTAGNYTVTIVDANLCSASASVSVVANPLPVSNAGAPVTLCSGVSGSIGAASTAGYTYSWSPIAGLNNSTAANPTVTLTNITASPVTTTYTVTTTITATGCTSTASVNVTVNPLPTAAPTATPATICNGASTILAANAIAGSGVISTYAWSSGLVGNVPGGSVSPITNTTYTVTVTNSNTCTVSANVSVIVNPLPVLGASNTGPYCAGITIQLNSFGGNSYSWSGPNVYSNGTQNPTIANSTTAISGTYTVTVTDVNTCTATASTNVVVNALPVANAGADMIITCTVQQPLLNATPIGIGQTYSWSGPGVVSGGNTAAPTVNAIGTYTLLLTDANNCTASDNAAVTSNTTPPNANAGPDAILTCAITSVTLTASSTTAGVSFAWSNGINFANNSVGLANTYTVTVTNPVNGCTASDNTIVSSNTVAPNANAGPDATLNCSVLSVTLSASSTTAGVSFAWSNGINTANNSVTFANTYTVTVTDPVSGCTASDAVNVLSNTTIPNVNAGADQTLSCTITSLLLNGSSTTAGVTYSWSGVGIVSGANTPTPTVNTTGTYTLLVTDPTNGCTANDATDVLSDTNIPNANAGPDATLNCLINSVTLTASSTTAGVSFAWSNGINTANNSVVLANTYTVTVTDLSNGCTSSDNTIVSSNTISPNANAGPDGTINCLILSVTLSASSTTAGVSFAWSNGINAANNSVVIANTYAVTVTDPTNGCTSSDNAIVSSNTISPNANAGPDGTLNCIILSVTLTASSTTAGVSFAWSNGINTANNLVSTANIYTVTVTDLNNGCTSTDNANVLSNTAIPNVNAGPDQTLFCGVPSLLLNGSSSTVGVSYSWSGAGILSGGNTATPNVNAIGTYTLIVTDATNGCTASDATEILPDVNAPNASAGPDATLTCVINSVTLMASSTTAGVSFAWSNGINTTNNSISVAGIYTVTVTDPSNGCTSSDQAVVLSNISPPNANAGPDAVLTCIVSSATLTASSSTAGVSFIWSTGDVTASTIVAAVNTYTVTITDAINGCTASDQAIVTVNNIPPNADAGPDKIISCVTNGIILDGFSVTTNAIYSWSGSGIVNGANTATPFVNLLGIYTLIVTDPLNGCTASDITNVVDPNAIVLSADVVDNPCVQLTLGQIDLHVSGGINPYNYLWSNNAVTEDISNLHGGIYSVTVTDNNGCTSRDSYLVTEGSFSVDAEHSATINLGETVQLTGTATGGSGQEVYLWSPDYNLTCAECTSPIASPYTDMIYVLEATDINGCTDYDTVKITVIPIHDIFIPNVFTPNGDGNNDYFEVFGNKQTWKQFEVQVFYRWGEKVYESNDMNFKWDGIYKGKAAPASVYVYQVYVVYLDNFTDKLYKGSVTLVR